MFLLFHFNLFHFKRISWGRGRGGAFLRTGFILLIFSLYHFLPNHNTNSSVRQDFREERKTHVDVSVWLQQSWEPVLETVIIWWITTFPELLPFTKQELYTHAQVIIVMYLLKKFSGTILLNIPGHASTLHLAKEDTVQHEDEVWLRDHIRQEHSSPSPATSIPAPCHLELAFSRQKMVLTSAASSPVHTKCRSKHSLEITSQNPATTKSLSPLMLRARLLQGNGVFLWNHCTSITTK